MAMIDVFTVTERKVVEAVGAWLRAVCSHPAVHCDKGLCTKRATRTATYYNGAGQAVATAPSCDDHGRDPAEALSLCDGENHLEDCAVELTRQDVIATYNARKLVDRTLP